MIKKIKIKIVVQKNKKHRLNSKAILSFLKTGQRQLS